MAKDTQHPPKHAGEGESHQSASIREEPEGAPAKGLGSSFRHRQRQADRLTLRPQT